MLYHQQRLPWGADDVQRDVLMMSGRSGSGGASAVDVGKSSTAARLDLQHYTLRSCCNRFEQRGPAERAGGHLRSAKWTPAATDRYHRPQRLVDCDYYDFMRWIMREKELVWWFSERA